MTLQLGSVTSSEISTDDPPRSWIQPYYPAFDGLRACAILMVFLAHYLPIAFPGWSYGGWWTGVDVFFVLSGFLITGILYDSRERSHYFRDFYARRALRIFPLYYGFFAVMAVLTPLLHAHYGRLFWTNLLYIENLVVKGTQLRRELAPTVILVPGIPGWSLSLGHFWSLCVEEQFYLVWPLIVFLVPERRRLMRVCAALIVTTVVLRTALRLHASPAEIETQWLYYSTYTRCDTLLLGAWLALWLRGVRLTRRQLRRRSMALVCGGGAVLVMVLSIFHGWSFVEMNMGMATVGYTLIGVIAMGALLLSLDATGLWHRLLRLPPLLALGRLSYGFYFFHDLWEPSAIATTQRHLLPKHLGWLMLPLGLGLSYAVAWLSFRFLESPFLRLKRRLPQDHPGIPPAMTL